MWDFTLRNGNSTYNCNNFKGTNFISIWPESASLTKTLIVYNIFMEIGQD